MTTKIRGTVAVLTLAALLALVCPAYAECAWVLWEKVTYPTQGAWQPLTSTATRRECAEQATDYAKLRHEQIGRGVLSSLAAYECFPDTVDPRGAKGK